MLNQQFSKMEVIEMAKDIEKRGLNFYRSQADKTDNKKVRELFLRLAGDEKDHFQRFDNIGE
ncbi:MAG: ferritin family protein, partial [Halanaerobiaceae bacterium]